MCKNNGMIILLFNSSTRESSNVVSDEDGITIMAGHGRTQFGQ